MTLPTLFVHIGLPKTASTWLQEEIFPTLDHLTVHSVPHTRLFQPGRNGDRRLMTAVVQRAPDLWDRMGVDVMSELLGARGNRTGRATLVSDEAIGRGASRPQVLAAHLAAMEARSRDWGFGRLHVLLVLRRQDHWLASHYAQVSDRRGNAGQADFKRMVDATLDPARDRFRFGMAVDHGPIIAALQDRLGKTGVSAFVFEALKADRAATLRALLDRLETPERTARIILEAAGDSRRNVRSNLPDTWTLRTRRLDIAGGGVAVPRWLDPRRGRAITLTPDLSARILDAYAPGNRAAARATGLDLAAHGYLPGAA